jgi:hypothetical protein
MLQSKLSKTPFIEATQFKNFETSKVTLKNMLFYIEHTISLTLCQMDL